MKRIGLVVGLLLAGFACSEGVGQMLVDAGNMIVDGSVPDAGADFDVACDKSDVTRYDDGQSSARTVTVRYAEFQITPGQTEVTGCAGGDPVSFYAPYRRDVCYRSKAQWYRGTSTGFVLCGVKTDWDDETYTDSDTPDPISITVHD